MPENPSMLKCPKCGNVLNTSVKFCNKCGTKMNLNTQSYENILNPLEASVMATLESAMNKPFLLDPNLQGPYFRSYSRTGGIACFSAEEGHVSKIAINTPMFYKDPRALSVLPDEIGNLPFLNGLFLIGQKFTTLPESIGNLKKLEYLDIEFCPLKSIPKSIGNMTSLKVISFNDNQLETIPEEIGNLKSLIELSIGANKLTTLPDSIGNLTSLKTLIIGSTKLSSLPSTIRDLPALKRLGITEKVVKELRKEDKKLLKELKDKGCSVD